MKRPAISVVIPCYNEERSLPTCLISLQHQTFTDFEVIVVDNNCTDTTADIAQTLGARIVREKRQGMIPAREKGFRSARGSIIARTDADSTVPPSWLADIHAAFENHPEAVALCCGLCFPEIHPLADKLLQKTLLRMYCRLSRTVYGHYPLIGPNSALRKIAWRQIEVHFNDRQVHEDLDLACHLNEEGEILYCPHIQTSYSLRRWKRAFLYTMVEYSTRYIRTLLIHNHQYLHYQKKYKKIRKNIKRSVEFASLRVRDTIPGR